MGASVAEGNMGLNDLARGNEDTKHEQRPYFPSNLGKAGSRAQTVTHGSQFGKDDLLEMNRLLSKEAGESLDSKIRPLPRPHAYILKGCQARQLLQGSAEEELLVGLEILLHPADEREARSAKDRIFPALADEI
ncbi:hypothetical protein LEMLEM_LOCUS7721 [Lemmus lemmus]